MPDNAMQGPDPTAPMERPPVTGPGATAPMERPPVTGPGATAPMERIGDPSPGTPTEPAGRWAASAPVGGAPSPLWPAPSEQYYEEPYVESPPGRSWLTPVLLGVVGLLLLGGLLTGLWLIFNADNSGTPAPVQSGPAPVQSGPATGGPSTAPTSARPSSPSPPPPTSAQAGTPVPNVVGLTELDARRQMFTAGLQVEIVRRPDASARPGTVIATEPEVGTPVEPGSVVRLVVAIPSRPSPSASSPEPEG